MMQINLNSTPGSTQIMPTSDPTVSGVVQAQINADPSAINSNLNLTGGGTPTWDTSTQKFGTGALASGYGSATAFPSWPGTSGTIQAWVKKATNPSANGYPVCFDNGSAVSVFLAILTTGVTNYGYLSGGTSFSFSDTVNVCDGSWHLLELDLSPSGYQFFVDGNLRSTGSAHVPDASQGPNFAIGARARTLTNLWQGEIDEVSIWNTNLHTVSYTPPASPWKGTENNLVELYHLDSNFTSISPVVQANINYDPTTPNITFVNLQS